MIHPKAAGHSYVDCFLPHFDDSLLPSLFCQLKQKEHTQIILLTLKSTSNTHTLSSYIATPAFPTLPNHAWT